MRSLIYTGKVMHQRKGPVDHGFTYPVYFYAFELDELKSMQSSLFGYNKLRPIAIHDKDYITEKPGTIKEKLINYLKTNGFNHEIARIQMITSARFFNYVFNPVSFFYCYNSVDEVVCIVAEVNNTFGERHLYILDSEQEEKGKFLKHYTVPKDFHVSPLYDMKGLYDFWFSEVGEKIDIRLNKLNDGKPSFYSRMSGTSKPATSLNILKTVVRFPLTVCLTYPRILIQAGIMYYIKSLPAYRKPKPVSIHTIKHAKPTWLQNLAMKLVLRLFNKCSSGRLTLVMPSNEELEFKGNKNKELEAKIEVQHFDFFWRLIKDGAVGLGEGYSDGLFKTPNLTALIKYLIANRDILESGIRSSSIFTRMYNKIIHTLRPNNKPGAKKNISAHYDLSNDLFKLFLDPSMTYSCAKFTDGEQDLEKAQQQKLTALAEKLRLKPGEHVLEIGCGWGSFAKLAATKYDCKVTAVTISRQQYEYVSNLISSEGLGDKIDVQFRDFRDLEGQFDKIVSIEMIEAIGFKNYTKYFNVIEKCLKPQGLVAIQFISAPHERFNSIKKGCDWIQKHIFPGSLIPSVKALNEAMGESGLNIASAESIGTDYAVTLKEWKDRFNTNIDEVRELGFDQYFINAWNYYFSYCEAAFATKTLDVEHLVLRKNERS